MKIRMDLDARGYDIEIARGALDHAGEFCRLSRRVLVVSEPGVPREYAERLLAQCGAGSALHLIQGGESGKSLQEVEGVLRALTERSFARGDCVAAVGGGVVGDLAGFAASCYMRGVDFYNFPTTLLSQIDSSIGGKTGVNFAGVKNLVGSFYQPRAVVIDPDLLATLPRRQQANGMAEAIKMAMNFDAELIAEMEKTDPWEMVDQIIYRSLMIKKRVVEQDEKEAGLRRVLNFGHTLGHGIEGLGLGLYHGECVALGMLPMCTDGSVRERLIGLMKKVGLPTEFHGDAEKVIALAMHDKKKVANGIMTVLCDRVGSFRFAEQGQDALLQSMKGTFGI